MTGDGVLAFVGLKATGQQHLVVSVPGYQKVCVGQGMAQGESFGLESPSEDLGAWLSGESSA